MRTEICVTAPAKINIGLHVLPGCVNGFHRIESIFQTVTLFDTLVVRASEKNGCVVDCEGMELPSDNTILSSYNAFRSVTGMDDFGVHVALEKRIPSGGGLGGGSSDAERYQNVYAKTTGSAACPTAGLHFTEDMLSRLKEKGIDIAWVTLHVGLGTFLPVRESEIEKHKMHEEAYTVPDLTAQKINDAKRSGRRVLAVGTTSVRTLESSCDENGFVKAGSGSTHIFMYPGFRFKVADELFTNFHTPESTLIMLVSAFAGREHILNAYKIAVEKRYRFFSYGDAMLIR